MKRGTEADASDAPGRHERPRARRVGRLLLRTLPYVLPPLLLDLWLVRGILEATSGELCPILDDAFIHFQYARSFAELHPLAYHAGDPPTTGATSLAYPALLAVGWLVGFRGMRLSIFAHALSVTALSGMLYAAKRLGDALFGPGAGLSAAVASLACPAFVFLALGGMEIGVSTALHVGALSAAIVWITAESRGCPRTPKGAALVVALGAAAALGRPEGAAASCATALALLYAPPEGRGRLRLLAILPLLPIGIAPLIAWVTTGVPRTNGMILKFEPANPYLTAAALKTRLAAHFHQIWGQLLHGEPVRRLVVHPVVPRTFHALLLGGAALLAVAAIRRHGRAGAVSTLALLGGTTPLLFPILYTWIGNLGRYVIAFVPVAAMVATLGAFGFAALLVGARPRLRHLPTAIALVVACLFIVEPVAARREPVLAARQICGQQVPMARFVRTLPRAAVIGLNDAGAIAYLGEHRTWDMVGLTSFDAARSRLAGDGAVFERMERLPPDRRPTHLAYYPAWFRSLAITGRRLHRVEVDGIYVGSWRKDLVEVRTELYGSGDAPAMRAPEGHLVDALDEADLADERAHDYVLAGERELGAVFRRYPVDGRDVADGGQVLRRSDRFVLRGEARREARWIFRTDAFFDATLEVRWNGTPLPPVEVKRSRRWQEVEVTVPASLVRERNVVERRLLRGRDIGLFHQWLYQ